MSPSVESPLPDFFGSGFASLDVASLPVVMKRGDYYLCRFRMPFARSADIRLDNGSTGPLDVVVEVEHRKMKRLAPDGLYFHARAADQPPTPARSSPAMSRTPRAAGPAWL
jgi:hypothetical protein